MEGHAPVEVGAKREAKPIMIQRHLPVSVAEFKRYGRCNVAYAVLSIQAGNSQGGGTDRCRLPMKRVQTVSEQLFKGTKGVVRLLSPFPNDHYQHQRHLTLLMIAHLVPLECGCTVA